MADEARRRRLLGWVGGVVAIVLLLVGVTTVTGFPGPGPLRRHSLASLNALRDELVDRPFECAGTAPDERLREERRQRITVDLVRSRVRVDGWLSSWYQTPLVLDDEQLAMIDTEKIWTVGECMG